MIQCCECGASLKYPVTAFGKIYGSDCASRVFGIHIPLGIKDATPLIENRDSLNANIQLHYDLFNQNIEWFKPVHVALTASRNNNEWEFEFLISILEQIGAYNFTDSYEWGNPFYLTSFEPEILSSKQSFIFNKIINKYN